MESKQIFDFSSKFDFERTAFKVFQFQAKNNPVYREFLHHLNIIPKKITQLEKIPFLPIQFFKSHKIVSSNRTPEIIFLSSGTTGSEQSKHFVTNKSIYEESFTLGFDHFYGNIQNYTLLALLPGYLERSGSSLIYMMKNLISKSQKPLSGFYLNEYEKLAEILIELENKGEKVLLVGVSFALLDFLEEHQFDLKNTVVMETGGMKGRRKEIVREELHQILCKGFGVKRIHSEYGMTELLSQAYSKGKGIFNCPPWMRIFTRDPEDPFTIQKIGKNGGINVIDLANLNSCSFIATQDLGKTYVDGSFEVIGRFDNSDIRGCNLMVL